ncbi:sigma-70 family RNA polymerase sigma factor [Laspinema olomoucense]|uniref:sigma-70 family RNA polymerase sigma factor n=1 Tax=Laspinema olomoucense TaxID=3231600 RepID=UPI0021BAED65|nr:MULTISPECIES: sigma-70 family RNA polymerase sigma factor [unclassified Laspinema]MCT7973226.1 sigma-70 family RNA polymerase sigma factor [Laspinema sp. D3d]MCT7993248.1 sigma-70 family RNA polymerase sigma factor [Laspinema sp. D3c]
MQPPVFSECQHPLVHSLFQRSDRELLTLFQRHPDEGKYFTAIFGRYSSIVYTLIQHQAKSPVQGDYLFAMTWRHIYHELRGLDLRFEQGASTPFTLQTWLINMTAWCIEHAELPPVESIHYSLQTSPPPLWCYVEQALDLLSPLLRITVLMAQTFHWSETRISAYLQAEGETIAPGDVKALLEEGYQRLESALPRDIRTIYLEAFPPHSNSAPALQNAT